MCVVSVCIHVCVVHVGVHIGVHIGVCVCIHVFVHKMGAHGYHKLYSMHTQIGGWKELWF